MPTYQYACTSEPCGLRFERVQSFTEAAITECPDCTGRVRKVYGSVGVVFKGSGFYRNDSRDAKAGAVSAGKSDSDGSAAAKSTDSTKSSDSGAGSSGSSSKKESGSGGSSGDSKSSGNPASSSKSAAPVAS